VVVFSSLTLQLLATHTNMVLLDLNYTPPDDQDAGDGEQVDEEMDEQDIGYREM
jgi:hypothetical protein